MNDTAGRVGDNLSSSGEIGPPHCRARVLVADDHDGWRLQVRHILRTRPEWLVVSDARDGLEVVQKAIELRPDVVLLDVGMPYLNGIEAAIRIRRNSPNCRVVFVTMNSDRDVVIAAFHSGAKGYVLKAKAGTELLPAIEAALSNGQH
jgi:DNA-binding NarL/FixJ family response regulator